MTIENDAERDPRLDQALARHRPGGMGMNTRNRASSAPN